MDERLRKCMLSLRKIADINTNQKIDITNGDIDKHVDGRWSNTIRMVKGIFIDHRSEIRRAIQQKYADAKELATQIIRSTDGCGDWNNLVILVKNLECSLQGLDNLVQNDNYKEDSKMCVFIKHFREDEVPTLIIKIKEWIGANPTKFKDIDWDLDGRIKTSSSIPIPKLVREPPVATQSPSFGTPAEISGYKLSLEAGN